MRFHERRTAHVPSRLPVAVWLKRGRRVRAGLGRECLLHGGWFSHVGGEGVGDRLVGGCGFEHHLELRRGRRQLGVGPPANRSDMAESWRSTSAQNCWSSLCGGPRSVQRDDPAARRSEVGALPSDGVVDDPRVHRVPRRGGAVEPSDPRRTVGVTAPRKMSSGLVGRNLTGSIRSASVGACSRSTRRVRVAKLPRSLMSACIMDSEGTARDRLDEHGCSLLAFAGEKGKLEDLPGRWWGTHMVTAGTRDRVDAVPDAGAEAALRDGVDRPCRSRGQRRRRCRCPVATTMRSRMLPCEPPRRPEWR